MYIVCPIYIIFKLLVIPGIIFDLLIMMLNSIMLKKISDFFFFNNRTKEIVQGLTLKKYIGTWKNDYFKHRITLLKQILKLEKSEIFNSPYIKKNMGKRIKCTTNEKIYKGILKKNISKDNLSKDKNSTIKERQPMEKLTLINSWVLWKNFLNIKFWKYIFRPEEVAKYSFIVNEELFEVR